MRRSTRWARPPRTAPRRRRSSLSARSDPLSFLTAELATLEREGRLRSPRLADPSRVCVCSNDYLGFGAEPAPYGESQAGGAGAARLVSGHTSAHEAAEAAAAGWVGAEAALMFSSGYAANVGSLAALVRPDDLVVSDTLNHASIIDGLRLSRARVEIVPHLDLDAVRASLAAARPRQRRWVVVESLFSMDGDSPDLPALREVCDAAGAALVVDEAHALGIYGPSGAGLCAEQGVVADVLIGTLGKAVGLQGAFVAGGRDLVRWLWNRARSFVFSTGTSPALAVAIERRIAAVRDADDRRRRLTVASDRLRDALRRRGVTVSERGPIFPWILGSSDLAVQLSEDLWDRGVHAQAIRPPTVPEGAARLRLTASASLDDAAFARVEEALDGALSCQRERRAC